MTETAKYADSPGDDVERAKEIIAAIIARRPGEDSAISSEDLADRTPVAATTVRDKIPDVIEEYNIPVATCSDGYYRADTHDAFVAEMKQYESQRKAAEERMEALAVAYYGDSEVVVP